MSVPIVYLPEAETDIEGAYRYYEHERIGLGDRFLGTVRRDIRAALLKRFPYVVYYRDRTNDALIIAVQHGRRSTRGWIKRH